MFIKTVQEEQDALKQHSLLLRRVLPHHSLYIREHILLSRGRPTSTLSHIHFRATGLLKSLSTHQNRTQILRLASLRQLPLSGCAGRSGLALTVHTRQENGALLVRLAVRHVCFQVIEHDSAASAQQERIREAGEQVKLFFFVLRLSSHKGRWDMNRLCLSLGQSWQTVSQPLLPPSWCHLDQKAGLKMSSCQTGRTWCHGCDRVYMTLVSTFFLLCKHGEENKRYFGSSNSLLPKMKWTRQLLVIAGWPLTLVEPVAIKMSDSPT